MDCVDDDADQIECDLEALRRAINAYHGKHHKFYRSAFDGPPSVPRPELLTSCRLVHDREEIIRILPGNGIFAEVGTLFGDFIAKVIEINRPREIHLFDYGMQNIRPEHQKVLNLHESVNYHIGDSSHNMGEMPDGYFDVIYVDADHSFEGVWKDLAVAHKKIKKGGYIVCNDYTNFDPIQLVPYGVYAAVNKFANENDYSLVYVALAAMGFHDVALQLRSSKQVVSDDP